MILRKIEDIIAWKKEQDLAVEIYSIFHSIKDFGFKDQIQRAVVSISNNIAEGYNRSSDADFSRFLYISMGSCSELISMIHLAQRLNYIDNTQKVSLLEKAEEVAKVIRGLIKSLTSKNS